MKKILIGIICFLSIGAIYANEKVPEKVYQAAFIKPTPRQLAWQKLELTAFFHYGINTYTDKEWGDGTESPKIFNPKELDCEQWIKAIKKAGFKLAIITAKHHDGFCLWPSKYTNHTVSSSPYKDGKGDIVKEFVDACHKHNLKIGIYLSPWDRHEKTYGSSAYNDFFANQITEILTNYGPVDEFWFDGACGEGPNGKKQVYDWNRFYKIIRQFNDQTVIAVSGPDVRWVGNESGLARESEWSVVPATSQNNADVSDAFKDFHFENIDPKEMAKLNLQKPILIDSKSKNLGSRESIMKAEHLVWYPAECDTSIRPGWFYHQSQDQQVKSLNQLIDIYFRSVGRNSVLLLNIPPDQRGLIHENDVKRLEEFGHFLRKSFSINFLTGAKIKQTLLNNKTEKVIELTLKKKSTFDCFAVSEDIRQGQRVEQFTLFAYIDKKWEKVISSTTIGYKRLLKFSPVTTIKIKLVIEQSRAEPIISHLGCFKLAD